MGTNKIAKLGFEGEMIVKSEDAMQNEGMEVSYTMLKAWDTAILAANKFGMYKIS